MRPNEAALPTDFFNKYLLLLNQFYPHWDKWEETFKIDQETILIPELLDLTKKIVGPTPTANETDTEDGTIAEQPSGFKRQFASKGNIGNLQGDNGEYKFQEKFASLKIGGILIANISSKEIADMIKNKQGLERELQFCKNQDFFETDFIFLHPKIGIYVIEVKSGTRGSEPSRHGKNQLKKLDRQLKDLFEECTGNPFLPEYFAIPRFRAICETEKKIDSQMKDWLEHIDIDLLDDFVGLKRFFTKYINVAGSGRNLFKDDNFRKIIALLVGFRDVPYTSLAQNAIFVTKSLQSQLLCPMISRNKDYPQNNSMSDKDLKINFTPEQSKALKCRKAMQVIYGPPGTGKTKILMKQLLNEARNFERRDIPLIVLTWDEHQPVFKSLINEHRSSFCRYTVQVGFAGMSESERCQTDVIRDELGCNNLSFLEWRAGQKCAGMRTIFALTGQKFGSSDCDQLLETISVLQSTMCINELEVTSLSTVMRGSKKIIEYWSSHLRSYPKIFIGHNFCGKKPEIVQCYTLAKVIEAVQERLASLIRQNISPKHIAIICPTKNERSYVHRMLFKKFINCNVHFGSVTEQIGQEDIVAVDTFGNTLSHEWPIVLMCSLHCAHLPETYELVASSRALALLVVIERDYLTIQNFIDQKVEQLGQRPCKGDFRVFVKNTISEFKVPQSDNIHTEIDKTVVSFHTILMILRNEVCRRPQFVLNIDEVVGLYDRKAQIFETFSDCLPAICNDEMLLRKLINYSNISHKIFLSAAARLSNDFSNSLSLKIRILEREHSSFFSFALKNLSKHKILVYENFLKCWGSLIEKIAEEGREKSPSNIVHQPCKSPWNLIVYVTDILISSRCSTSFEVRTSCLEQ